MSAPIRGTIRDNATLGICLGCMEAREAGTGCSRCGWNSNPPVSVLHLAPGTVLHGCYLVGRVLGQGGFGITYLGWDMALSRKIAIKEYFPQTLASRQTGNNSVVPHSSKSSQDFEHGLNGFLEEGRILARFSQHPCIVPVLSLFEANGTGYLVMGYIEGITLAQYLAKQGGRIPYGRAYEIMLRVMDGLREVHGQGLLHRDISPDNIYLSNGGAVKILDFGAARFAALDRSQSLSVVLKPGYAPEEQYRRNGKQGAWTDVYATAATFYRCITGTPPPESLERLVEDSLQTPRQLGLDIPPKAEEALVRALAVRAERRFETMEIFQRALAGDKILETHHLTWPAPEPILPPGTTAEEPAEPEIRSRASAKMLPIGLGAAALLIGAATLIGMKYLRPGPTAPANNSVKTLQVLPAPLGNVSTTPGANNPRPEPKPNQPSQTDDERKQLEQIEAEKKKAQADAAEAARRQQQAEAAAARARAAEEASARARADAEAAARARADAEAAARARAEAEAAEQQRRQQAAESERLARLREEQEQALRKQQEAARNPDWVFSGDGKTYKMKMENGLLTITPSTGSMFAQLPIKTNKKGQTQIMGQWQAGVIEGFVLIQAMNDRVISGYMLIPQMQGANCTTRTAAFLGNWGNDMNHQIEGCRLMNVSWHKQ